MKAIQKVLKHKISTLLILPFILLSDLSSLAPSSSFDSVQSKENLYSTSHAIDFSLGKESTGTSKGKHWALKNGKNTFEKLSKESFIQSKTRVKSHIRENGIIYFLVFLAILALAAFITTTVLRHIHLDLHYHITHPETFELIFEGVTETSDGNLLISSGNSPLVTFEQLDGEGGDAPELLAYLQEDYVVTEGSFQGGFDYERPTETLYVYLEVFDAKDTGYLSIDLSEVDTYKIINSGKDSWDAGLPHSLKGIMIEGEFTIAFDDTEMSMKGEAFFQSWYGGHIEISRISTILSLFPAVIYFLVLLIGMPPLLWYSHRRNKNRQIEKSSSRNYTVIKNSLLFISIMSVALTIFLLEMMLSLGKLYYVFGQDNIFTIIAIFVSISSIISAISIVIPICMVTYRHVMIWKNKQRGYMKLKEKKNKSYEKKGDSMVPVEGDFSNERVSLIGKNIKRNKGEYGTFKYMSSIQVSKAPASPVFSKSLFLSA